MFIGSYPLQRGGASIYQPIGGGLQAGIYASNSAGTQIYYLSGANEFSGVTFDSTYDIYYFEIDSDLVKYPVQSILSNALVAGVNTAIPIVSTHGNTTVNVIMYLATALVVDNTPDEWYYLKNNLQSEATITGGAWSADLGTLSIVSKTLTKTYEGAYLESLGWGDYSFNASITDPNGVVTQASNNGVILATWTPNLYITAYRVDGVNWVTDVEPIPEIAGYDTLDIKYIDGGTYALDSNGDPVYDVGGAIGNVGGTEQIELAVPFNTGLNSLYVSDVSDSGGNLKDTAIFYIAHIPDVQYVGATTFSKEADGLSVTVTNGLLIDSGLASEVYVDITFNFTDGLYEVYNFPASYTNRLVNTRIFLLIIFRRNNKYNH